MDTETRSNHLGRICVIAFLTYITGGLFLIPYLIWYVSYSHPHHQSIQSYVSPPLIQQTQIDPVPKVTSYVAPVPKLEPITIKKHVQKKKIAYIPEPIEKDSVYKQRPIYMLIKYCHQCGCKMQGHINICEYCGEQQYV
jgi:hypothetical protein